MEATMGDPSYIEATVIDGRLISYGVVINQNIQNILVRGFTGTNSKIGIVTNRDASLHPIYCSVHNNIPQNGAGSMYFTAICTSAVFGFIKTT